MAHHEQLHRTSSLRDAVFRSARSFYQLLGNRRKFERMPLVATVVMTFRGRAVETTEHCASVDISPRGIGLDCPSPIELESVVELHVDAPASTRLARVRYCRPAGAGYRIGLEFLTDPNRLG